jgi:hypothetical protein
MSAVDLAGDIGYAALMGRDVSTMVTVGGKIGPARAVLEHDAVILRGDLRQRIPRDQLTGWQTISDDLNLATTRGPVILHLGAEEAAAWARALNKPAPGLAQKLGLTSATRLWRAQPVTDPTLADALHACPTTTTAQGATLGLAMVMDVNDLDAVIATMTAHPDLPVWVVNAKGPKAAFGDTAIRTAMRAAGLIDTKTCAVSAALSATRYAWRKG